MECFYQAMKDPAQPDDSENRTGNKSKEEADCRIST
jgi:hypothetical protein